MGAEHAIREQVLERLTEDGWQTQQSGWPMRDSIALVPLAKRLGGMGSSAPANDVAALFCPDRLIIPEMSDPAATERAKREALLATNKDFLTRLTQPSGFVKDSATPLIDTINWETNSFDAVKEVVLGKSARADIVLYVNGIPLVVIELKGVGHHEIEAINQLTQYAENVPEAFATSLFSVSGKLGRVDYGFAGVTDPAGWVRWHGQGELAEDLAHLVEPRRICNWLGFQLFKQGKQTGARPADKVIPRQHQVEAAEGVVRLLEDPKRTRGLIQHHQGAGKSILMLMATNLALDRDTAIHSDDP